MKRHRITTSAVLGLAIAAVAAPSPATAYTDLRSPDARDSARIVEERQSQAQGMDLRSPDARDAAEGRGTFSAPEVTVVRIDEPSPSSSGGLDWGDVGIGAGGLFGLILLTSGAILAVMHRKHRPQRTTVTTA